MSAAPLISVERASFGFGSRTVLADVQLEIGARSFLGILGPNGSGKTTLFRGLLGLVPPSSGRVTRNVAAIGYVPQRERLDPAFPLTVEEVVQMGAFARSSWKGLAAEDRELTGDALERVRLFDRRRAPFASLSGGQRQRALIARALLTRPRLLLLDEPTSGVDQPTQELILELITELHEKEGLGVLLVTHQLSMIRTVRDVLWVAEGRVQREVASDVLRSNRLSELFGFAVDPLPGSA